MEKSLILSNELHFISKKLIHQAVEKMVESLDLAAGSTTGFNIYAVVESYFTDLEKRKEINQLLNHFLYCLMNAFLTDKMQFITMN